MTVLEQQTENIWAEENELRKEQMRDLFATHAFPICLERVLVSSQPWQKFKNLNDTFYVRCLYCEWKAVYGRIIELVTYIQFVVAH